MSQTHFVKGSKGGSFDEQNIQIAPCFNPQIDIFDIQTLILEFDPKK